MAWLWQNSGNIESKRYRCGHCDNNVATNVGYFARSERGEHRGEIYICHFCGRPTFFDNTGDQVPGASFGNDVKHVDDASVKQLYDEARQCISVNASTASVLSCRKLLMNIAVSKGADEGKNFIEYVEYLADKNFIPPDARDWVDHIRQKGNEATHEIAIRTREEAEEIISFIEMLLKIIYEFPANVRARTGRSSGEEDS